MTSDELLCKIESLPVEKRRLVEEFVQTLMGEDAGPSFEEAAARVFAKHETLFRKLADS
ncbi:hypothetical protein TSACC_22900 [Terrimicrobium sacchariphilum]|uniref:Addiction module component n=1 Tax=Terrimicrobium sacchariphilum TaxID=690879 RepID=A0A146GA01_TERSA|nr:hypothetical protein [Terrimicrobium sacchariphilum]GAT34475.1 hypothetical protein TSACC_22900 [Terrimicrobium sacchariphilum]